MKLNNRDAVSIIANLSASKNKNDNGIANLLTEKLNQAVKDGQAEFEILDTLATAFQFNMRLEQQRKIESERNKQKRFVQPQKKSA